MGVVGRTGSFGETSSHEEATPKTNLVEFPNGIPDSARKAEELAYIEDTFLTRTSLNVERFDKVYGTLLAYPEGTPVVVTYYHQHHSQRNIRSTPGDISHMENSVHKSITKISQFEFRITEGMQHTFEKDDGFTTITGTGVTYSGFVPYVGDMFLYNMGDGKIGIFKINDVDRLSHRHASFFKIDFEITQYLTKELLEKLDEGVTDVVVFDRHKYLNEGFVFLNHESYNTLKHLEDVRLSLCKYYSSRFFYKPAESYLRYDGLYDPYLVKFLLMLLSIKDTKKRPLQLWQRMQNYDNTIWYWLKNPNDKPITEYGSVAFYEKHIATLYDTDKNYLMNNIYLAIGNPPPDTVDPDMYEQYVFSSDFYKDATSLTMFEQMVKDFVLYKNIDPVKVLDHVSGYSKLEDYCKFYHIPIYILLVDGAINGIR